MKYSSKYEGWSSCRGHEIGLLDGEWVYCDTDKVCDDSRSCAKCGLYPTPDGHDPCIANLNGVANACCGHGVEEEAYVQFDNGLVIRGEFDHIKWPHLYNKSE